MNQKWYEKNLAIILFLIFFFPVGIFLMWKYSRWNKVAKIIISIFFGLVLIVNLGNGNKTDTTASKVESTAKTEDATKQEENKEVPKKEEPKKEGTKITYENFLNIKMGQSYDEVVALLGEGKESSSSEVAGIKTTIYQWNGSGVGNMNITIQNGAVTGKAQMGLQSMDSKITMDLYNQIQNGMTYEQTKAILGEGQIISEVKIMDSDAKIYSYANKNGSNANFTFSNDSMDMKAQFNLK